MDKRVSLKPSFYMMVGLSSTGKTTASKELLNFLKSIDKKATIVSCKDVSALREIRNNLGHGMDVIYDAENIRRKSRKHFLQQLPECNKVAVIVWARYETCLERDKGKQTPVGQEYIEKELRSFQIPFYDEGWDEIKILLADQKYTEQDYDEWMDCPHDNPHHLNTVGEHTQKVIDLAFADSLNESEAQKYQSALMYAILGAAASVHDIGKKFTKVFVNARGEKTEIAHYYDHHRVGAWLALGYEGLDVYSPKDKIIITWLVNVHMEPELHTKYYNNLSKDLKYIVDKFKEYDIKGA